MEPATIKTGIANWQQHTLMLQAGKWKKGFSDRQYKLIVALALNDCTEETGPFDKNVQISGYFISKALVCVVFLLNETGISDVTTYFYEKVKRYIRAEQQRTVRMPEWEDDDDDETDNVIPMLAAGLFTSKPAADHRIAGLITGQRVTSRYYDPKLERLRKMVQEEIFCSAKDYADKEAKTPVRVTVPEKNDRKGVSIQVLPNSKKSK